MEFNHAVQIEVTNREGATDERRMSPRVAAPYPVRLKSTDSEGRRFKEETLIENLSSGGLYLRLTRAVPIGAEVALAARLSTMDEMVDGLRLAARGTVVRVEPKPEGDYGVAVKFNHRRVL